MIYYPKPMHLQKAFEGMDCEYVDLYVTEDVCQRVLALPMHPYMTEQEIFRFRIAYNGNIRRLRIKQPV